VESQYAELLNALMLMINLRPLCWREWLWRAWLPHPPGEYSGNFSLQDAGRTSRRFRTRQGAAFFTQLPSRIC